MYISLYVACIIFMLKKRSRAMPGPNENGVTTICGMIVEINP
ncbi:hypothetical protein HMPREF0083_05847 [Aneurinibacillus aneurinilyticus ATCC 12856]|uniref:Uncharacterized protein n=1 Tax=Aneurinibacillus aneurinilyticus ATCC 12856 TaxID=649747 RepID=U1WS01_ANEAE|nr:hypothetical protein HMPREF0083_05847 [Aneurinibacillus aneurinilyticus ATCC 12856]